MATVIRSLAAGLVAASTLAAACAQDVVLAGLTPPEQVTVRRYLNCIDCLIPLDSLLALSSRKPDETIDSLYSGLRLGPGVAMVAAAESVLTDGYVRDSTWRFRNNQSPLPDRLTYVQDARDRFVNGWRSRGAIGLGWIHTPRAVELLDSAYQDSLQLPPTVKRAVLYARDSLPPP